MFGREFCILFWYWQKKEPLKRTPFFVQLCADYFMVFRQFLQPILTTERKYEKRRQKK